MRTLSKRQLLGLTITSGVVFFVFLFANVGCLVWTGLIGACVFGPWWYYKYQRDQKLIEAGHTEQITRASSDRSTAPSTATKGSSWLGVPPKLER